MSANLRKAVTDLLDKNWGNINRDMKKIHPRDRLSFIEKILGYALPKLSSTTTEVNIQNKIEGLTHDKLEALIDKIVEDE